MLRVGPELLIFIWYLIEYDTMDMPMLKEVIQMLRQQLEKAQVDRNYVQHERVSLMNFNLEGLTSQRV